MLKKLLKKNKIPNPVIPRKLEEIIAAYNQARARAGELQYNIFVYENELAQLNGNLKDLNYEAAERQRLDKIAAEQVAKDAPAPAVPVQAPQGSAQ